MRNAARTTVSQQPQADHSQAYESTIGAQANLDVQQLAQELRKRIRGEVRFDDGSRALYATDASNYRHVPIGVVVPRSKEDVIETLAVARRAGAPVLARGGGTSLAGQCCNVAVVLDLSKHLNRVIEIDPPKKLARVEPGCLLDTLRSQAEKHTLTFAPDPSTHNHCTLGGMIGNNSCGVHSMMGGKTDDNIEELEILTYDGLRTRVGATDEAELARIISEGGRRGEIYSRLKILRDNYADLIRQRFPDIPRCVSGYNLTWLLPEKGFHVARALVGSECTCVMVLEATTRLVHSPPGRALLVLGYRDVYSAADHVVDVLDHQPIGLEGIDDKLIADMKRLKLHPDNIAILPEGKGWLLVEFGGDTEDESKEKALVLMEQLKTKRDAPSMKLFTEEWEEKMIWKVRESGLGATAHVPDRPVTWEGWEDSAVPPDRLGQYLRELRKLMNKYEYTGDFYGHFGQGCLHTRINFDLQTRAGIDKFRSFLERAADLVLKNGGSLSGEHGDGQARGWLLERMFGPELIKAFREFKSIWDPEGKMNPGKIVDPYRVDENLRLGTDYHPTPVETHFRWPKDDGDFARVALRCVGVGECRRYQGGTMCPSFRVTGEEMHSTRGRARLLWEMLQGDVIRDGFKSEAVKEALDLCLACKGCKSDCPVSVDMATYKAEFLSQYYKGRLRPPHAYAFGYIDAAARFASIAPQFINFFTQTAPFSRLAKWVVGMPQQRRIPAFAPQTFKRWFKQHQVAIGNRESAMPQILLWADTFNNYFLPQTARAAVAVLEAAGFQIIVPSQNLCCGRPLYDFGLLPRAIRLLKDTIAVLRPFVAAGVPVVGLEPSCVAVFRDELTNLLPDDEDAQRLSRQTYLFSEFLEARADFAQAPKLRRRAIIHDHCHKKAVIKKDDDWRLLRQLGVDFEILDSGCCGMAGSFGFVKEHFDVSRKIGELILLPAVRDAPEDTLIIADGFSCREQIAQTTNRRALHSAEVVLMALQRGIKEDELAGVRRVTRVAEPNNPA